MSVYGLLLICKHSESLAVGYDCLRISGLSYRVITTTLDPDGLFARQLPIALSCFHT